MRESARERENSRRDGRGDILGCHKSSGTLSSWDAIKAEEQSRGAQSSKVGEHTAVK